jgi:hypothetical protein
MSIHSFAISTVTRHAWVKGERMQLVQALQQAKARAAKGSVDVEGAQLVQRRKSRHHIVGVVYVGHVE